MIFSFIFDNKDGHWDETNIARAYITGQGGDEDVNNDNDYGWVIAEDNIDDWNDRNIFSERPMVVATIKKHSAFQLDSSADIYIHDVRKVDIEWP